MKDFLGTGVLPSPRYESLVSVCAPGMVGGPCTDLDMAPAGLEAGDVDSAS